MKKESYTYYLTTLAPIHLGCDEVYEPMGFVLQEDQQQLVVFDSRTFFQEMNHQDRKRFAEICRQGTLASLLDIYKFFRGRQATGRVVEVCQGLVEQYRQTLSLRPTDEKKLQQELNQFTIARTAFLPNDGRPYIPGSAIKGALRTAYLNHLAQTQKFPTPRGRSAARDLEKILLDGGSFDTDPFRMLKISDFQPVGETRTRIVYAVNEKKKPSRFQARGPFQILEVIQPGTVFTGQITLEKPHPQAGIRTPLDREILMDSAATFYRSENSRERHELIEVGVQAPATAPQEAGSLLRLGRHSGAEALTIEGHRTIKIMQAKGERPAYQDQATTFWLAADERRPPKKDSMKPFGWALIGAATPEMEQRHRDQEEEWQRQKIFKVRVASQPGLEPGRTPGPPRDEPREVWGKATLTWNPGNQQLTAIWQNRKATYRGHDLLPENLRQPLLKKRKAVTARVTVTPIGNAFQIINISAAD